MRSECIRNKREDKPSVLVVCQYYYPENFQITPICEALVTDGYAVTVITGLPNYPTGIVPGEYRQGHRDENINGVRVVRCFEIGRKKGPKRLFVNYMSFVMSSLVKVRKIGGGFDIVLCYQLSPVLMGLPAMRYVKEHNVPLLFYCCDLWPESVKAYVKNEDNPLFKLLKIISTKIYGSADKILVQSKSFIRYLSKTHGISLKQMTYVPAFADESYLEMDFTTEDNMTDFVFMGNLGMAQDLFSVLKAICMIKDLPNIRVHFVGDGSCAAKLRERAKAYGLGNIVRFYGRRPVEDMPKFYKIADACLVSLKADNATGLTLPSKVQGYMAAGKPIIAMLDGAAKDTIKAARCGICVPAGDIRGLGNAMKEFIIHREMYSEYGKNGRIYFKNNFSKHVCIARIEEEIDMLVGRHKNCQNSTGRH